MIRPMALDIRQDDSTAELHTSMDSVLRSYALEHSRGLYGPGTCMYASGIVAPLKATLD